MCVLRCAGSTERRLAASLASFFPSRGTRATTSLLSCPQAAALRCTMSARTLASFPLALSKFWREVRRV